MNVGSFITISCILRRPHEDTHARMSCLQQRFSTIEPESPHQQRTRKPPPAIIRARFFFGFGCCWSPVAPVLPTGGTSAAPTPAPLPAAADGGCALAVAGCVAGCEPLAGGSEADGIAAAAAAAACLAGDAAIPAAFFRGDTVSLRCRLSLLPPFRLLLFWTPPLVWLLFWLPFAWLPLCWLPFGWLPCSGGRLPALAWLRPLPDAGRFLGFTRPSGDVGGVGGRCSQQRTFVHERRS